MSFLFRSVGSRRKTTTTRDTSDILQGDDEGGALTSSSVANRSSIEISPTHTFTVPMGAVSCHNNTNILLSGFLNHQTSFLKTWRRKFFTLDKSSYLRLYKKAIVQYIQEDCASFIYVRNCKFFESRVESSTSNRYCIKIVATEREKRISSPLIPLVPKDGSTALQQLREDEKKRLDQVYISVESEAELKLFKVALRKLGGMELEEEKQQIQARREKIEKNLEKVLVEEWRTQDLLFFLEVMDINNNTNFNKYLVKYQVNGRQFLQLKRDDVFGMCTVGDAMPSSQYSSSPSATITMTTTATTTTTSTASPTNPEINGSPTQQQQQTDAAPGSRNSVIISPMQGIGATTSTNEIMLHIHLLRNEGFPIFNCKKHKVIQKILMNVYPTLLTQELLDSNIENLLELIDQNKHLLDGLFDARKLVKSYFNPHTFYARSALEWSKDDLEEQQTLIEQQVIKQPYIDTKIIEDDSEYLILEGKYVPTDEVEVRLIVCERRETLPNTLQKLLNPYMFYVPVPHHSPDEVQPVQVALLIGGFYFEWNGTSLCVPRRMMSNVSKCYEKCVLSLKKDKLPNVLRQISELIVEWNAFVQFNPTQYTDRCGNSLHFVMNMLKSLDMTPTFTSSLEKLLGEIEKSGYTNLIFYPSETFLSRFPVAREFCTLYKSDPNVKPVSTENNLESFYLGGMNSATKNDAYDEREEALIKFDTHEQLDRLLFSCRDEDHQFDIHFQAESLLLKLFDVIFRVRWDRFQSSQYKELESFTGLNDLKGIVKKGCYQNHFH